MFPQSLAHMQKGSLPLYSHREVPFGQVVAMLEAGANLIHSPVLQVMVKWTRSRAAPVIHRTARTRVRVASGRNPEFRTST